MKKKIVAGSSSDYPADMEIRRYLVNGFSEKREVFLRLLKNSGPNQRQYNQLMYGEEVTIEGNIFQIENVEGI